MVTKHKDVGVQHSRVGESVDCIRLLHEHMSVRLSSMRDVHGTATRIYSIRTRASQPLHTNELTHAALSAGKLSSDKSSLQSYELAMLRSGRSNFDQAVSTTGYIDKVEGKRKRKRKRNETKLKRAKCYPCAALRPFCCIQPRPYPIQCHKHIPLSIKRQVPILLDQMSICNLDSIVVFVISPSCSCPVVSLLD